MQLPNQSHRTATQQTEHRHVFIPDKILLDIPLLELKRYKNLLGALSNTPLARNRRKLHKWIYH